MGSAALNQGARYSALRSRNFSLLWIGLIVSNAGTWMQNVASGWLVLQLTDSPLWLGLLGLSFALPMIVLPVVGGAVVDRVHRIRLLYVTQTGSMLLAFTLALLTWLNLVNVWHLLAVSFLGAALLAFDNPARQALLPELVPPADLMNAISLNSATYNGAALVGPAIAGALLGPLGAGTLFFLNGVSYLAVIFALLAMRDVRSHGGGKTTSLRASMWAGLAHAANHRFILALLALSALAGIFGRSYQNLLPVFARDIWNGGPAGYGILLSSAGGGALLGALGMASVKSPSKPERVMLASGLLFGLALFAFALSPNLILGALLLFVSGTASTVFGTMIATFVQLSTPNELRGRVMSLYAITLIGLPSLGALGSGAVAEWLGGIVGAPRAVLAGALVVCLILIGVTPYFARRPMARHTNPSFRG